MHYISLPIYPLHFPKFCPIQKQWKTLRNCQHLVKTNLAVYLIFCKHIFFETKLDHISRIYNQINYRHISFPKVIMILIMMTQVLLSMFFPKKTRTLMPLRGKKAGVYWSNVSLILYVIEVWLPDLDSQVPNSAWLLLIWQIFYSICIIMSCRRL